MNRILMTIVVLFAIVGLFSAIKEHHDPSPGTQAQPSAEFKHWACSERGGLC